MDHYIDITLLPDPEFKETLLMGAVFNKLHRGLVALQDNRLAISFVRYERKSKGKDKDKGLGNVLRVHGNQTSLARLMETHWLRGMGDHSKVSDILPVPADHHHLKVARVQCKSNVDRLRSRRMKRHGETLAQATLAIPESVEKTLDLPFIVVKSTSTDQQFRLFIDQHQTPTANPDATFNCYGLSNQGTVPGF